MRAPLSPAQAEAALIQLLQLAYSGELAAANAYRGHGLSVSDFAQHQAILHIEIEELAHRHAVGELLNQLRARPQFWRERFMSLLGQIIGLLCHFGGWYIPMYGAGKLESRNVEEYVCAARYAWQAQHSEMIPVLLEMAEAEWEHEQFFRRQLLNHPLRRWLPLWPELGPKAQIRLEFSRFCQQAQRARLSAEIASARAET